MSLQVIKLPRPIARIHNSGNGDESALSLEATGIQALEDQVRQLEEELQQAREEAYQLGLQGGLGAEREKYNQKIADQVRQFTELAERLESEFGDLWSQLEGPIRELSFSIAEKILTSPLPAELREGALQERIQTFLKEVLHAERVVIRLSPDNMTLMQSEEVSKKLGQTFPGKVKFVMDNSLAAGECLVETPEHLIDGRYQHQLELLESGLR